MMGWLLDNGLANMQGTNFLVFYALTAAVVLAGAYFFVVALDRTDESPPPATPGAIDPYELAYLRGGANEVIRTAVYSLRRKGLVEIDKGRLRAAGLQAQQLAEIERSVYEALSPAPKISALFVDKYLQSALERLCEAYRQRLSAERLLASSETRRTASSRAPPQAHFFSRSPPTR